MRHINVAVGLCAVLALQATGCSTGRPVNYTLAWIPGSLRTVHAPDHGFYCYAPSIIQDGSTDHLFVCSNREPFVIRDHILGFTQVGGSIGSASIVLAPSPEPNAWDSFHACDPSVIAGQFRGDGVLYRYAMFYLGNDVDACQNNQIGVAFAKTLTGPWCRHGPPIVPDAARGTWGTGQPSAVSIDRKGRVLLFYTKGHYGAAGCVRELDLSNAADPQAGEEIRLSEKGLTRIDGGQDWLNNFDVVLDRARNRFIIVRERHPYPTTQPDFIGEQIQVASLEADRLKNQDASWKVKADVTPALTGFARNHNAGVARTAYGELPSPDRLRVFFSSSKTEPALQGKPAVWSYVLHEITAEWRPAR